jgi:predicted negative regulator of RcsB-dependent stress response
MANHLDLEEQEQLDQLKHFWKQYGSFIQWGLIIILGAFAAWYGYQEWQRKQSLQASALFEELENAVENGDLQKTERAFADIKERFSSTTYAHQAGLLAAKTLYANGRADAAKAALTWVAEQSSDKAYASIALLRLSGLLIDAKAYDEALTLLSGKIDLGFVALAADRKGDIYLLQGKKEQAKQEYQKAFSALPERNDYKRLVAVKLSAVGGTVASADTSAVVSSSKTDGSK